MFNFIKQFFASKNSKPLNKYQSSFETSLQKMNKNCEYMQSLVSSLPESPGKQKVVQELQRNSQAINKLMNK